MTGTKESINDLSILATVLKVFVLIGNLVRAQMEALARYLTTFGVSESEARESVEMTTGSENIVEALKIGHDIGIKLFILHRFDPTQLEDFKKEVIMKL